jgi:two-component system, chemotaxis family, CheB/CheR fusion protein
VLIYLNQTAQERVMHTFHFALNPGGFLFLGSSESADGANDLYSVFNRQEHIFQKRHITTARPYPVPDSVPSFPVKTSSKAVKLVDTNAGKQERITFGDVHLRLLEEYAPPSLIVNEEYDIVHLSERAGRYLQMSGGEVSPNLLKLIRQELRLELRAALYQAVQGQIAVEVRGLKLTVEDRTETVDIHVRPVLEQSDIARGFILVVFERVADEDPVRHVVISSDQPVAKQLEDELVRLKAQLRSSNEQHEFHAEELKASNEELQAMNEELRSSAEELETSKEELQSINEELRTVNQELKVKVDETTIASNNIQNLINSVDIGTIFLDRGLRVAFFTPAARQLFNLLPADYGRPLSDITGKIQYDHLTADAESVLEKLQAVEKEVNTIDGHVFLMRVLPYRTAEDKINGVVVTFFDITTRKKTEEELRGSEERLRMLIESAKDYAIFMLDTERRVNSWNTGAQSMFGYEEKEILGQSGDIIFIPEDRAKNDPQKELQKARDHGVAENERWHLRKNGSRFYGSGTVRPLLDGKNSVIGYLKIMRDLTESKKAEEALRESEQRLRITLESAEMGVWDWRVISDKVTWNKQHSLMLGLDPTDEVKSGTYVLQFIHKEDVERAREALLKAVSDGLTFQEEFRVVRQDNKEVRWMNGYGRTIEKNANGSAKRIVGVMYDITQRKKLEQQKDELISVASHELKTPVTSIMAYTQILQDRFEKMNETENSKLMQKLNAQVERLNSLIKDLLDTTNLSEGRLPLHKTEFDLDNVIAERLEEFQYLSARHKLVFKKGEVGKIKADKERIEQVLNNLFSNAIKYSPEGGEIVVSSEPIRNGVKVSIQDKGIGIPDDLKSRVFERFFRVSNPQVETYPGMGLGLYISAGIIHRHGGTIAASSKLGEGSIFHFTLPLE